MRNSGSIRKARFFHGSSGRFRIGARGDSDECVSTEMIGAQSPSAMCPVPVERAGFPFDQAACTLAADIPSSELPVSRGAAQEDVLDLAAPLIPCRFWCVAASAFKPGKFVQARRLRS